MSDAKPITDAELAHQPYCSDNHCEFVRPEGVGTNGGCHCLIDIRPHTLRRDVTFKTRDLAARLRALRALVDDLRAKLRDKIADAKRLHDHVNAKRALVDDLRARLKESNANKAMHCNDAAMHLRSLLLERKERDDLRAENARMRKAWANVVARDKESVQSLLAERGKLRGLLREANNYVMPHDSMCGDDEERVADLDARIDSALLGGE